MMDQNTQIKPNEPELNIEAKTEAQSESESKLELESELKQQKTYIFVHKEVRNDYHCPICKQYYVTLYYDIKKASRNGKFKLNDIVWVDEWVRRRNGDKYHLFEVIPNNIYDLQNYDITEDTKNIVVAPASEIIQFMFLHVILDTLKWCPDNIKYEFSLHTSFNNAFELGSSFLKTSIDKEKLEQLQPVWIDKNIDNSQKHKCGAFYQIIKINYDETICLNKFCPQAQPDVWKW